jgi:EAL domain-containing protein (putative c-di-GMP-specific phosphodiesterase class I)
VIAQAVISLGHSLGLRVLAEGVETRDQLDFLRHHGCNEYQGYFFSRPCAVDALTAMLAAPLKSTAAVRPAVTDRSRQSNG